MTASPKDYTGFTENTTHADRVASGTIAANGSLVLKLYYDRDTHTVSFNSNGGTDVSAITGVRYEATITAPTAPTRTGYTFAGWYKETGLISTWDFGTDKVTADMMLFAKWMPNAFTVTFDANGGGDPSMASKTVTYDSTYGELATVTREGYDFKGWFTAASGGTEITEDSKVTIAADHTLYAQWAQSGSSGDSSSGDSTPSTPSTPSVPPANNGVDILINGKTETAATATTTQEGDKTVTTVVVDDNKMEERLAQEGNHTVVTIPVSNATEVVVGTLNGQTVKNMEMTESVLEITTGQVAYTLPAEQINIDAVSEQIGREVALKDIAVSVKISEPPAKTVKIVADTANQFDDVAPGAYYYDAVSTAYEYDIISGYGNGEFAPDQRITREQAMVMIARALKNNRIGGRVCKRRKGKASCRVR
ncbi:MAG: hypothetical protein GX262_11915 [Clostridia bacterium]|nr:hypothetical protein [Clostridia bacterium]